MFVSVNLPTYFYKEPFLLIISVSCENQTRYSVNNELKTTNPLVKDEIKTKDEKEIFPLLKKQSKSEGKNIFLVFSMRGCTPCIYLERYHNDSIVRKILSKYVIVRKFDINKTPEGGDLYKKYWKIGLPLWVLVNYEGEVIIDSGDPDNNFISVGYPHNTKAIKFYITALKKAAPAIEQGECEILKMKLTEYYGKNRR